MYIFSFKTVRMLFKQSKNVYFPLLHIHSIRAAILHWPIFYLKYNTEFGDVIKISATTLFQGDVQLDLNENPVSLNLCRLFKSKTPI